MDTNDGINLFDDLDDNNQVDNFINSDKRRVRYPARHFKVERERSADFVNPQDDSRGNFNFTYHAARFEEGWLTDSLGEFFEQQWITDVLRSVKGGKEASVYQCRGGSAIDGVLAAAKVYRPRILRAMHNDHAYRQGRTDLDEDGHEVFDDRQLRAIQKKTDYGRELLHQSWIAYDFTTLRTLFDAGVDVPQPYTMATNAILMGFVGEEDSAAPSLSEIRLEREEARRLFDRTIENLRLMLEHDRVHGDLSAYNILYWEGEITLIDFPQVVSPNENSSARAIFGRDVQRVCEYFQKQGVQCDPSRLATELWAARPRLEA